MSILPIIIAVATVLAAAVYIVVGRPGRAMDVVAIVGLVAAAFVFAWLAVVGAS